MEDLLLPPNVVVRASKLKISLSRLATPPRLNVFRMCERAGQLAVRI